MMISQLNPVFHARESYPTLLVGKEKRKNPVFATFLDIEMEKELRMTITMEYNFHLWTNETV